MIKTTHGMMEETALERTVLFEDRPAEFVVAVEWRSRHDETTCSKCQELQGTLPADPRPVPGSVLVRRDAHCILKEPSVVASAIAASL